MALPYADMLIAADTDAVVQRTARGARRQSKRGKPQLVATPRRRRPLRRPGPARASRISRRNCARPSATAPDVADPPADFVERRVVAVPSSARLSRQRRRRRTRRWPRHFGRLRARAQGHRPPADRDLRRRRFPDGRHRDLDRGALPHSDAVRRRQQQLVLQRRSPPGARRAHAQSPGRKQMDRPAHQRSRSGSRRAWPRAGRTWLRPGERISPICRRSMPRRLPRSKPAKSRSSTCTSSRAMRPHMAAAMLATGKSDRTG